MTAALTLVASAQQSNCPVSRALVIIVHSQVTSNSIISQHKMVDEFLPKRSACCESDHWCTNFRIISSAIGGDSHARIPLTST